MPEMAVNRHKQEREGALMGRSLVAERVERG